MSRGEFYKMEFDAWDEGTADLTLEEEAAYLRLCHQMYRRQQSVPVNDRLLCSLWRCHQNKARPLLQKLISKGKIYVLEDGRVINDRVRRELDARETLRRHRADAGHTGGTRSAEARRKSLENNDAEIAKSTRGEERRGEERRERKNTASGASIVNLFTEPDTQPDRPIKQEAPEAIVFREGRELLGKSAGGMIKKLLDAKGGNIASARAAILEASTKDNPRQYIGGIINRRNAAPLGREPDRPGRVYGEDYW
jgi:uncharacterized protein YdaU (DUF1376 family)